MNDHWTKNCLGIYGPIERGADYKYHKWPGKDDIKEGDTLASPVETSCDETCEKCEAHFEFKIDIQFHRAHRTKSGSNRDRLLWRHDGIMKIEIPYPSRENVSPKRAIDFITSNQKYVVQISYNARDELNTFDKWTEVMNCYKTPECLLPSFYKLPMRIWAPKQWDPVPNNENTAISMLENL